MAAQRPEVRRRASRCGKLTHYPGTLRETLYACERCR